MNGFEGFLPSSKSIARNYPLLMAVWKVTPSLAAGCTAVLKPSELASVTCSELADICREVSLPPGVLNVLTGLGSEAGALLASHPNVEKIVFTGSFAMGSNIMTAVAQLVKPVSMELGGKSPLIVFDDIDLDKAAEWALFGCFWTNCQICSAKLTLAWCLTGTAAQETRNYLALVANENKGNNSVTPKSILVKTQESTIASEDAAALVGSTEARREMKSVKEN